MYLDCDNCQEFRQADGEAQPSCKCDPDKRPCMMPKTDPDTLTTNPLVASSSDDETGRLLKLFMAIHEFCVTEDTLRCEQCVLKKHPPRQCAMKSFIEDVNDYLNGNEEGS